MNRKILCRKIELDTSPEKFGELHDSSDILGDVRAMRERMAADGYLLFRGLVERDKVLEARREILLKYATIGEIDSINHNVMDAVIQRESFIDKVNLVAFTESIRSGKAYQDVSNDPNILGFFQRFLGGKTRSFDFKWPRFVRPGEGTGIHSDNIYVTGGTKNVWTCWIPIGDVAVEEGPVVLLEGSHRSAKLLDYWAKDADKDKVGWLSEDPIRVQEELGGRWLTTSFRAGDVLCFDVQLVHASLDNMSGNRCRLTSDTRYHLEGEPLDERWNGGNVNPHKGAPKVFLPGLRSRAGNKEFEEEWKPVDALGRLKLDGLTEIRSNAMADAY
jgi:ectoine hydroxylase-related dioxygenase (phytanoyl-CoA dioxygenase family)